MKALHIIQEEPERIEALWEVTRYALKRFREAGFEIGDTESPIIPLYVRDTEKTFVATARAEKDGQTLSPGMKFTLSNIRASVTGYYIKDLDD